MYFKYLEKQDQIADVYFIGNTTFSIDTYLIIQQYEGEYPNESGRNFYFGSFP